MNLRQRWVAAKPVGVRTGYAALWLLFLIYPIGELINGGYSDTKVAVGLVTLTVFVAVYLVTCTLMMIPPHQWWIPSPWAYALPVTLCLLTGVMVGVMGAHALGMAPFLIAAWVFLSSVPVGIAVVGIVFLVTLLVPEFTSTDLDLGSRIMIFVVGLVMLIGRYLQMRQVADLDAQRQQQVLAKQLAVSQERERVARDVHDILGHSLTVMTLKSELAQRLVDRDPEAAKSELAQLHQMSRDALTEIRATVSGLRIADIEVELLSAQTALDAAGIVADLPTSPPSIGHEQRSLFGWVLREAVTNIVRHSNASRCAVRLEPNSIRIDDDGSGMRAAAFGNGLSGLRERVAAHGGELSVGTAANGSGTRVEVTV